jgi:hypothetical protein
VLDRSEAAGARIAVVDGKTAVACEDTLRILVAADADRFIKENSAFEQMRLSRPEPSASKTN